MSGETSKGSSSPQKRGEPGETNVVPGGTNQSLWQEAVRARLPNKVPNERATPTMYGSPMECGRLDDLAIPYDKIGNAGREAEF